MCQRQFTVRSLGFSTTEVEKESFYTSQWGDNRVIFLIYRCFVWFYSIGWTVSYLVSLGLQEPDRFAISYTFLTNWGDVTNTIYFTFAAALAIVGVVNRRRMIFTDSVPTKILRSLTWAFFTITSCAQIVITVTYWAVIAPTRPAADLATAFNIHRHAINLFLIITDLWISAFPVRILHFVYGSLFALAYILMTVIEWATGGRQAVYFFLNWENNSSLAAGISAAFAVLGPLICQAFWFGMYKLKMHVSESCHRGSRSASTRRRGDDVDNPAFDPFE